MLYRRTSLFIHSKRNILHLLAQTLNPPHSLPSLSWQPQVCFCESVSDFVFFLGFLFVCFAFWGCMQHMQVPRLGVELELELLAYATATLPDLSHVCDLHKSSWQCRIINPLSETRHWTCILMDASQICFHWATRGTPCFVGRIVCALF